MKQLRMSIITLIAMVAIMYIGGEPVMDDKWLFVFLSNQIIGCLLFGVAYGLYRYWDRCHLLPEKDYEDEYVRRY